MDTFVHLRKRQDPRRLHADLDGLKDGSSDAVGSPADHQHLTVVRPRPPTGRRVHCEPIDVLCQRAQSPATPPTPTVGHCRCSLTLTPASRFRATISRCRSTPATWTGRPFVLVRQGTGLVGPSSGRCPIAMATRCTSQGVHVAPGARWRIDVADDQGQRDQFRVPPPGSLGRHFPFDPSQAIIPDPTPIDDDDRDDYEVRLCPRGRPDNAVFTNIIRSRCRRLARRQTPAHVQHRRLQRDHLRQRPPAADRAPVHAGHRRLRDESSTQTRRRRSPAPNAHPGITATSTTTRSPSSTAARSTASRCLRA